jgi:hypothetical protein
VLTFILIIFYSSDTDPHFGYKVAMVGIGILKVQLGYRKGTPPVRFHFALLKKWQKKRFQIARKNRKYFSKKSTPKTGCGLPP